MDVAGSHQDRFACALLAVNASSGPVGYVLSKIYTDEQRGNFSQLFAALVFCGIVCGQLIFGVLSDRIGRKFGMIFCSVWLTVFSVLIAGAWGAGGSVGGLFAALIAYRFLQGIAIGGEYPAGSVASSENTESKDVNPRRQQMCKCSGLAFWRTFGGLQCDSSERDARHAR